MFETNKIAEAVLYNKLDDARALLNAGETLQGQYFENNKTQIFDNLVRNKASDIVDVFIDKGLIQTDVYELDDFERSFFKSLARNVKDDEASIHFLKSFLEKTDNKNDEVEDQTLLGYFLNEGAEPAAIQCLIDFGCDVRYKNNAEKTLVHEVVSGRRQSVQKGTAYLNLLLDAGADADAASIGGNTPLLTAAQNRQKEYMEILLQHGANPNEQDKDGYTAFYVTVVWQQDKDIYDLLKQYAAPNFDLATREGGHLFTDYLKKISVSEPHLQLLKQLLEDGADVYQTFEYYGAPKSGIDEVAEKPSEILKALLDAGVVDINRRDNAGNTLLHKVCAFDVRYEAERAKEIYKKVKLLLAAGADTSITNDKDETAQMLAQQDNLKIKTVELLMQKK